MFIINASTPHTLFCVARTILTYSFQPILSKNPHGLYFSFYMSNVIRGLSL